MPRPAEQYSNTPFARMLTAFMWSKTPPWSTTKVAAVLNISRSRVSNWVYKNIVPDLDTMLVVMARLNIPVAALLQAYAEDGLPMPPLSVEEAKERQMSGAASEQSSSALPQPRPAPAPRTAASSTPSSPSSTPVPHGRYGLRPSTGPAAAAQQEQQAQQAQQSPYDDETPDAPNMDEHDSWAKMIAHTRKVMAMAGMPASALEAMLAEIEQARDNDPTDLGDQRAPSQSGPSGQSGPSQRQKPEPAR